MAEKVASSYESGGSSGGPLRKYKKDNKAAPFVPKGKAFYLSKTLADYLHVVEGPQELLICCPNQMRSNNIFVVIMAAMKRVDDAELFSLYSDPGNRMRVDVRAVKPQGDDVDAVAAYVEPDPVVEVMSNIVAEYLDIQHGPQTCLVVVSGTHDGDHLWLSVTESCKRILNGCSEIKVAIDYENKVFVKCPNEDAAVVLCSFYAIVDGAREYRFHKVLDLDFPVLDFGETIEIRETQDRINVLVRRNRQNEERAAAEAAASEANPVVVSDDSDDGLGEEEATLLLVLISYSRLSFHHKGHSSAMSSATGKGDASGSGSKRAYVLAMFRLASEHLFLLDVHVYVLYIFFLLMAKCFNYVVCT
ncbi:hypothetical protein EJB05_52037, partial [Eragrostis curvula]